MVLNELEDRLYTSTEVANILGVSLRSVYRYLEDGKLDAEMKTATGRHRFTKQNIIDFMSPQRREMEPIVREAPVKVEQARPPIKAQPKKVEPEVVLEETTTVEVSTSSSTEEEAEEVDWLTKFRQAAEKYRAEQEVPSPASEPISSPESVSGLTDAFYEPEVEVAPVKVDSPNHYYKSNVGGLKDIAQNIDKSARKASLDYAFTLDAGLSLHKPIRPFSIIHSYVRSEDLAFFEKILDLKAVDESDAQLCLIVSDDAALYSSKKEIHGLNVVSDEMLKNDLSSAGKEDLLSELD